jgi:hypothetical protein
VDTARVSVHGAEVENPWGAVYLNGLNGPLTIPWEVRRSNLAFVRELRRQGALVCYQGGWSREVLLDALRYRFQPRAQDANLLEVEGLPAYPNTAEGMMQLSLESYYRLLNCGLRLAAGAESAAGAKNTPAGYNRAYVRAGPATGSDLGAIISSFGVQRHESQFVFVLPSGGAVLVKVTDAPPPGFSSRAAAFPMPPSFHFITEEAPCIDAVVLTVTFECPKFFGPCQFKK